MTDAMTNNILCMIQKGIKQVEISRLFGISNSTPSKYLERCRARETIKTKSKMEGRKFLTVREVRKMLYL